MFVLKGLIGIAGIKLWLKTSSLISYHLDDQDEPKQILCSRSISKVLMLILETLEQLRCSEDIWLNQILSERIKFTGDILKILVLVFSSLLSKLTSGGQMCQT